MPPIGIPLSENDLLIRAVIDHSPYRDKLMTLFPQNSYPILDKVFSQKKVMVAGGITQKDMIELSVGGNAQRSLPYEELALTVEDDMHEMDSGPLVQMNEVWAIEDEELAAATDSERTMKVINLRRARMLPKLKNIAESIEYDGIRAPENANDKRHMRGVQYWASKADTGVTTNGDDVFIGKTIVFRDGTTSTVKGNIDAATEELWRNPVVLFDALDGTYFEHASRMYHRMKFTPPGLLKPEIQTFSQDSEIWTGLETIITLEGHARAAGDAFSADLGFFGGRLAFRGVPYVHCPGYDDDPDQVQYWHNWAHWQPRCRAGWWMKEMGPFRDALRPLVAISHIQNRINMKCTNPREGVGVMHTPR